LVDNTAEGLEPSSREGKPAEPEAPRHREGRASHLAFVAHEVRNPLSTALWSAELLARMPAAERGGPRGEKLAAMCLRALTRLRLLVEDHFLSERLDIGGMTVREEVVPLLDLLAAAAARLPAGAVLRQELEPDLLLLADRVLAERLLDAVLASAARDGGEVRVAARRQPGGVELRVRGAPPEADRLADPVPGSASDSRGRALSLPTARRVAEALGGVLAAEPAEYRVLLPAHDGPASEAT
jgi:signal transduction histidine kinase